MKRLLSFLLTLMLFCSIVSVSCMNVSAASNTLVANKTYDVSFCCNENTTKTFTYVMPESGYFYYTIIPYQWDESDNWWLPYTKMTVNYKLYEEGTKISYGDTYKSGSYCFNKGTKIKISLQEGDCKGITAYYKLKVYLKKPKNFEKENNNSKNKATKLEVGKTYTGISQQYDKDWWVFTAPESKKYKISAVEVNEGKIQTVKAYKNMKLISSTTIESNEGYGMLYRGYLKKGQKIYILLDDGSKDEFYKLKVKNIS